jgi:hypothetical protein
MRSAASCYSGPRSRLARSVTVATRASRHPQRDGQAAAVDPNPWSGVDPLVAVDGGIGIGRRVQVEEVVDVIRTVVGPIELEPAARELPRRQALTVAASAKADLTLHVGPVTYGLP